jgi:release factor glutamine methyltransferase
VAAEEEARELIGSVDAGALAGLIHRRRQGEPLAWLVGRADFCGLRLKVDPGVFVPRWQSEPLARRAAHLVGRGRALDLCTGSGAVAAVMQAAGGTVIGTDTSPVAVSCARSNGVDARLGSLDEPAPAEWAGSVEVLAAVVPYVPTPALDWLPRDVTAYEPRSALDGGPDGLRWLQAVVERAPHWLCPGGKLLLELGAEQVGALGPAIQGAGLTLSRVLTDDDGDVRGLEARLD